MLPFIRAVAVLAFLAEFSACDPASSRTPATSLRTYPHALDRYARILRGQLVDPEPVKVEQELACEGSRISDLLGVDEATRRMKGVRDSVLANPRDRAAHERVLRLLSDQVIQYSGPLCDSLNAIADREDPIVRIDTALAPSTGR